VGFCPIYIVLLSGLYYPGYTTAFSTLITFFTSILYFYMTRYLRLSSLLIVLLGGWQTALAQKATGPKAPIQFGEVAKADFSPTPPSRDSAAVAEILCDYGQSGIVGAREKFQVVFERVTRIHILRKAGYDWATVRVPLYVKDEQQEKISNLKGITYNLVDGKVEKTKLDINTGAFNEKVDKNHVVYSFTMPNVREGSIVEFTYVVKSDFLFNLQDWQFQHDIPVRWSEYRVTLPSFFRYKQLTRGYLPFAVQDQQLVPYRTTYQQDQQSSGYGSVASSPSDNAYITTQALQGRWVLQDAPAFREEPYMTTAHDYLRSVHFELAGSDFSSNGNEYHDVSGTWETITKNLLEDEQFGGALKQNTPLMAAAQALRNVPDLRLRAETVWQLVQQAVHYNGEERLYATQSLRKVYEQHRGNSAEVNLLLLQGLRAAGLEANPVLLSTRHHGQVFTDSPLLSQFNYVVAHVALPDQELLLDATEPLAPLGVLPERCLNDQGRLLAGAGRWVPLTPNKTYLHYTNAQLTLSEAGALQGKARLEYGGYAALEARQQVVAQGEAAYKKQLGRRWTDWQLTGPPELLQLTDPAKPFAVDLALALPGPDGAASTLYLPLMQAFGLTTNPFRHEDRFFPVDLGMQREYLQTITLQLPKNYTLQEKPADLTLALPDNGGRFIYHMVESKPGTWQISARLQLAKTSFAPSQYASLREFYNRALAKYGEMLVLQRSPQ